MTDELANSGSSADTVSSVSCSHRSNLALARGPGLSAPADVSRGTGHSACVAFDEGLKCLWLQLGGAGARAVLADAIVTSDTILESSADGRGFLALASAGVQRLVVPVQFQSGAAQLLQTEAKQLLTAKKAS